MSRHTSPLPRLPGMGPHVSVKSACARTKAMQNESFVARLRASYVAVGLLKPETRIAASATVLVTLIVIAISRVPMRSALEIDLTKPRPHGVIRDYTALGFSLPADTGSAAQGKTARIVLSRALPEKFELEIEARYVRMDANLPTIMQIAETRLEHAFMTSYSTFQTSVEHKMSTREIDFLLDPRLILEIKKIAIRPQVTP
jgi:hypothetical protein